MNVETRVEHRKGGLPRRRVSMDEIPIGVCLRVRLSLSHTCTVS